MDGPRISPNSQRFDTASVLLRTSLLACFLVAIQFAATRLAVADDQPGTNPNRKPASITAESIETLRKQAAEAADLDADTKSKIEAATVQALDGLKRIADLSRLVEVFKRDSESIQQRVDKLRQRRNQLQNTEPFLAPDLTLSELEQEVSRHEVNLAELKATQSKIDLDRTSRPNRRREIRTLLLSTMQRLADIQKQIETAPPADEALLLTQARQINMEVRRRLIEAEEPALQNELAKYDAEDVSSFQQLELDVIGREIAIIESELASLQQSLSRKRAADSTAALQRAHNTLSAAPAALRGFAEKNVELAEAAYTLAQPIDDTRKKLAQAKVRLEDVQKQFTATQQRVNDIGLTGSIGALLRRQRLALPDVRRRKRNVYERKTLIEDAQYALFEYDDLRSESIDAAMQRMLAGISLSAPSAKERLQQQAQQLAEQQREHLDGVLRSYNAYLDTLFELDTTEQRLIRETERYQDYIDERVLWIRSNRALFADFTIDGSDSWVFDVEHWRELGEYLVADAQSNLVVYCTIAAILSILLWLKPRYRRELDKLGKEAERGNCASFTPTARATFLTLMLAILWPGLVIFISWRCSLATNGSQFVRTISQSLLAVALVYFPLELLRRVCARRGLADSHFDWHATAVRVFRTNLRWVTMLGLLVVFLTSLLFFSHAEHGVDAIERVCFITGMLILAVFKRRVLRPDTGLFHEYLQSHPGGWFDRLKGLWHWGCVCIPLMLAGMTALGYYYTAQQLTWRLYASILLVVTIQLLRAFLQRWLLMRRRSISIQQARERRAAEAAVREQGSEVPQLNLDQIVPEEEKKPDVATHTEQSQRLLRTGLISVTLVGMWLIWVDVMPALRYLDQWPVWTTTVTTATAAPAAPGLSTTPPATSVIDSIVEPRAVTVADLGLAILIAIVTIVCARNVPGLMEITLLQRLPLDNSVRYAITSITSYAIVLLGVILGFSAISIGWSKVQWLATALTFGLAFGLQEIFANFVAGLILLFERPIRVGDVVTVDEVSGVISRIRIRATTITNWDRKEYVIPNKEFITGRMLNWTLSDKLNRIVINVGVAYGSDVERAKALLLKTCQDHPLILDEPPTVVTFEGFGDNSLNLVVRTFLPDLDNRLKVIDRLHTDIDLAFRAAGIEIAFPQRDLHLRSVDRPAWETLKRDETT